MKENYKSDFEMDENSDVINSIVSIKTTNHQKERDKFKIDLEQSKREVT